MKGISFNSNWQLRLNPFTDWDNLKWFGELLNPMNKFPLDDDRKSEMLNFSIVAFEVVRMIRNRIFHRHPIPNWTDIIHMINQKADEYWEKKKRERCRITWIKIRFVKPPSQTS